MSSSNAVLLRRGDVERMAIRVETASPLRKAGASALGGVSATTTARRGGARAQARLVSLFVVNCGYSGILSPLALP